MNVFVINRIFLAFVIAVIFSSCRKSLTGLQKPEVDQPYSFSQIFESFWRGISVNYVFWDIDRDKTDWDAAYNKYQPLFEKLNLNNDDDVIIAVDYIKEITRGLTDGHLHITFNDPRLAGFFVNPAKQRKILKDFGKNITKGEQLYRNVQLYFDNVFYRKTAPINLLSGTINDSVLYLYFDRFALQEFYNNSQDHNTKNILDFFFEKSKGLSIKKIIVDLRGNGGGNVEDLNFLIGRLISSPLHFGYLKYKAGPNKFDYSPRITAEVLPRPDNANFTGSIRVLTDGLSKSMAEICAMSLRTLPNSKIIGDTTWGATGLIPANFNSNLFNGGAFIAAKYVNVYTPAAAFIYKDGLSYEGKGFPPDIYIQNNDSKRDTQLETAVMY